VPVAHAAHSGQSQRIFDYDAAIAAALELGIPIDGAIFESAPEQLTEKQKQERDKKIREGVLRNRLQMHAEQKQIREAKEERKRRDLLEEQKLNQERREALRKSQELEQRLQYAQASIDRPEVQQATPKKESEQALKRNDNEILIMLPLELCRLINEYYVDVKEYQAVAYSLKTLLPLPGRARYESIQSLFIGKDHSIIIMTAWGERTDDDYIGISIYNQDLTLRCKISADGIAGYYCGTAFRDINVGADGTIAAAVNDQVIVWDRNGRYQHSLRHQDLEMVCRVDIQDGADGGKIVAQGTNRNVGDYEKYVEVKWSKSLRGRCTVQKIFDIYRQRSYIELSEGKEKIAYMAGRLQQVDLNLHGKMQLGQTFFYIPKAFVDVACLNNCFIVAYLHIADTAIRIWQEDAKLAHELYAYSIEQLVTLKDLIELLHKERVQKPVVDLTRENPSGALILRGQHLQKFLIIPHSMRERICHVFNVRLAIPLCSSCNASTNA